MSVFTYTATREIAAGSTGSITCNLKAFNPQQKIQGSEQKSLSGVTVSILNRLDVVYSVSTVPQTTAEIQFWREFAASCANGELFTVDASDIPDAPAAPFSGRLVRNSYKESREQPFISVSFQFERV